MLLLLLSVAARAATCPTAVVDLAFRSPLSAEDPRLRGPALVVVYKEARSLGLYADGQLVDGACWSVGLAPRSPPGPKQQRGDLKTPEGFYRTSDKPWSQFYGAIAVHYPGESDAAAGLAAGLISRAQHDAILADLAAGRKPDQGTRLGGEILVHGGGGDSDWTLGCVALDDADLDDLRARLPAGMRTDILILP